MNGSFKSFRWHHFRSVFLYVMGGLILFTLIGITVMSLKQVQSLTAEVAQLQTAVQVKPDLTPLQTQITSLQQQIKTLQGQQNSLAEKSVVDALQQQVNELDMQLHQQTTSVTELNSALTSLQNQPKVLTRPSAEIPPASRKKVSRPVLAPFSLTGIEMRGGIAFAAVAPLQAYRLSDVSLIGVGESRQGWTLLATSGQQAQFSVGGKTRTLTVRN